MLASRAAAPVLQWHVRTMVPTSLLRLVDDGAIALNRPSRSDVVGWLNVALATAVVCALRCRHRYFTAGALSPPEVLEEFMRHAQEGVAHADLLARRISQLGGRPDFSPDTLSRRSFNSYDDLHDLNAIICADLAAERLASEGYSQTIAMIGDTDPSTRRLLEDIVRAGRQHAGKLKGWLPG